jgi:hypothetical protein
MKMFKNVDECIQFINSIEDEQIFLISSGELASTIVPIVYHKAQMHDLYIFFENKVRHGQWIKEWPKVNLYRYNINLSITQTGCARL